MSGLNQERIHTVVLAHRLTEQQSDAATAFALDVIQLMIERKLSRTETACALELLAHLRNDLCQPH